MVSTIHAFCWELMGGFDNDIREALLALNVIALEKAKAKAAERKKGENAADLEKYAKLATMADGMRVPTRFLYHPDKNTYGESALNHAQVLDIAAWLIGNRPTLQQIIEDRQPLILIDESQDTMKGLLDSLFGLCAAREGKVTLGLLGDHRQRIYQHGHDHLPSHIPSTWTTPALSMNHRSQLRIVSLINSIWEANLNGRTQPSTGVRQHSRTEKKWRRGAVFCRRAAPERKTHGAAGVADGIAALGLARHPAGLDCGQACFGRGVL